MEVLAPFLKSDFQLSNAQVGLISTSMSVGLFAFSLPAGKVAERANTKRVILLALLAVSFVSMTSLLWGAYLLILILVFGIGAFWAFVPPATNKIVVSAFPRTLRATAIGMKQSGAVMGGALGIALLPIIASLFSWRISLLIASFFPLAAAIAAWRTLRLGLMVRPLDEASPPVTSRMRKVLTRDVLLLLIASLLLSGARHMFVVYVVIYNFESLNISPANSGAVLGLGLVAGAGTRFALGLVSDRALASNRKLPVVFLEILALSTLLSLAFSPPESVILVIMLVAGIALTGWNALLLTILVELAGAEETAMVSGVVIVMMQMGRLVLVPTFGLIVDLTGSFATAWLFSVLILVIALVVTIVAKEERKSE